MTSQDIRNFFASKPKAKGKEKNDDDDFVVEKKNKRPKKMIEDSDSDSDIIAASPQVKRTYTGLGANSNLSRDSGSHLNFAPFKRRTCV